MMLYVVVVDVLGDPFGHKVTFTPHGILSSIFLHTLFCFLDIATQMVYNYNVSKV